MSSSPPRPIADLPADQARALAAWVVRASRFVTSHASDGLAKENPLRRELGRATPQGAVGATHLEVSSDETR